MYEWATGIRELSVAEHSEPPPVKSPPQLVVQCGECTALSSLKSLLNDHIRQRIQVTDNSVAKLIRLGGECH